MKSSSIIALTLLFLIIIGTKADHYAVLVAGSNFYYNYRHQSDIFHAYQLLVEGGIKPENIITFAYDDIATDPRNPFPGQVFNKPSTGPGRDVYKGVVIDYRGNDVTPQNFLSVLRGDSAAVNGSKVLQSTGEDNVFIYFSDHGSTGMIAFPNDYLFANDLIDTLTYMNSQNKYKQMVVYIEACESGSMFDSILPSTINIYATTAANPDESSFATYCAPNNTVNGTNIGSCLGDLYSVNFLENLEGVNPELENLLGQFKIVKQETFLSHVEQYGDLSIDKSYIADFEGNNTEYQGNGGLGFDAVKITSAVDSRYVKLHYLQGRHQKYQTEETKQELEEELYSIQKYDNNFFALAQAFNLNVNSHVEKIDFDCLKMRVAIYETLCGEFSDYGLKYVKYLHYTCVQGVDIYEYEDALIHLCFQI